MSHTRTTKHNAKTARQSRQAAQRKQAQQRRDDETLRGRYEAEDRRPDEYRDHHTEPMYRP